MHHSLRFFIILFTGLFLFSSSLSAQWRRGGRQKAEDKSFVAEAEECFRTYRFEEASELYGKEIEAVRRRNKSTALLEAALAQTRMGENMLQATEYVVFVDSLIVPATAILPALQLSKECGSVLSPADLSPTLSAEACGVTAYLNELRDRAFFSISDKAGHKTLHSIDRTGKGWSTPHPLSLSGGADAMQDFPFMMPDGVTLYYAAQGNESLGGYDIFVTRYNAETGEYVKPENIGMPFNSPANDYLYAIDEATGVGAFITDRNQPADSVCIYRFIPGETRRLCTSLGMTDEELRRAASIASIAPIGKGERSLVEEARSRLRAAGNKNAPSSGTQRFVINDNNVYTSLSQFRQPRARLIAEEWLKESKRLADLELYLDDMRNRYRENKSSGLSHDILNAERKRAELAKRVDTLAKSMRNAEIGNSPSE